MARSPSRQIHCKSRRCWTGSFTPCSASSASFWVEYRPASIRLASSTSSSALSSATLPDLLEIGAHRVCGGGEFGIRGPAAEPRTPLRPRRSLRRPVLVGRFGDVLVLTGVLGGLAVRSNAGGVAVVGRDRVLGAGRSRLCRGRVRPPSRSPVTSISVIVASATVVPATVTSATVTSATVTSATVVVVATAFLARLRVVFAGAFLAGGGLRGCLLGGLGGRLLRCRLALAARSEVLRPGLSWQGFLGRCLLGPASWWCVWSASRLPGLPWSLPRTPFRSCGPRHADLSQQAPVIGNVGVIGSDPRRSVRRPP